MPISYYDQLKQNLTADATAKKAAYDAIYDAYTQAQFDDAGNVSYKEPGKLGTRDVQYDTETRNIRASGESSGTLRSGQQARNLANSLAGYKADILGKRGQINTEKAAVDTATTTELAKYQAMYGGGTGSTATTTPSTPSTPVQDKIAPVPTFSPTPTIVPGATSAAAARIAQENTKMKAPVKYSPAAVSQVKKAFPAPKAPAKPTPKKSLKPKRIGVY
jgi:hypothetical protein